MSVNGNIADTGFQGGSIFEFDWQPADYDALGHHFKPLRYGRVEIDLDGRIADGVIVQVGEILGKVAEDSGNSIEIEPAEKKVYRLQIATQADLTDVDMAKIAIRVLS